MRNNVAFGTNSSIVVTACQVCGFSPLQSIFFVGFLPPVNTMPRVGTRPAEQPSYPAQWLYCPKCHLVQLGLIVDPKILFPSSYPYTSSTTKILRENFAELYVESSKLLNLTPTDLIIDIGSNDGNLLVNFKDKHKVLGITPEEIGRIAISRGIPTIIDYFTKDVVDMVIKKYGKARVVTATNVFAHIENINEITRLIIKLLRPDGVFISESHYLFSLIKTIQYDTIYHEHLRYYSLASLTNLLSAHGLVVFHAKKIPTHGGSIRVYAARKGVYTVNASVKTLLSAEKYTVTNKTSFATFKKQVVVSKLKLHSLLLRIKTAGKRIYGISAPSRATTLTNYVGIDDGILDCVLEIAGSHKIGKYVPGTLIPVLDEKLLYKDQPEYALLLSWHIADELIPKLKAKGFKGKFIVPLPEPRIVS